jgi:Protein of unknown function (DUF3108)
MAVVRNSLALGAACWLFLGAGPATAQVSGRYEISIAGLQVGAAAMEAVFDATTYQASVTVRLSGVAKLVTSGKGNGSASGRISGSMPVPAHYSLSMATGDRQESIRMGMSGGSIRSLTVEPERPLAPDTIPVQNSHRNNVLDPLSAGMFFSSKAASAMGEDACAKTYPVFDGRQRYELGFHYDRRESVKAQGYDGPVLVCKARYKPISGHVAGRADVQFMANNDEMEVWLAPVANSRAFVPAKIMIRTQVGMAEIEATKLSLGVDSDATASVRR